MKSIFFDVSLYACLISAVAYLLVATSGGKKVWRIASSGMLSVAALSGLAFLARQWGELRRPPFVTTFEVMTFLAVALMVMLLIFERVYRTLFVGPFVAVLILMVLGYATLFHGSVQPVMPALRNNFWLTIHVVLCFIGYAGLFLSFVAGFLHLTRAGDRHRAVVAILLAFTVSGLATAAAALKFPVFGRGGSAAVSIGSVVLLLGLALLWPSRALLERLGRHSANDPILLDTLVHRSVTFGFPFLGLGIVTGAVWANEAWGRYWGWDPKETWSLITWLVYFLYLHFRFMRNWSGARSSWFAVAGFYFVVFTFFGVSYLLPGLHGYLN